MKIMVISPTSILPPVHGGPSRTYYFCKHLAKSHDVMLVSPPNREIASECALPISFFELSRPGRLPQFFDPVFLSRASRLIKREKPDIVQIEFVWPGLHAIILRMLTGVPFVLDAHNVEFMRRRRMKSPIWPLLFLYELAVCREARSIFCVSDRERDLFVRLGVLESKLAVVPNGFDPDVFFPSTSTPSFDRFGFDRRPTALFFGALEYLPNREAVDVITRELFPRVVASVAEARFMIVGRNPPANGQSQGIVFTGAVDRIQDFINAADVCICPLRVGGGTRLKIIEALACGKPVVSTSVGVEGLAEEALEQGVTIADNWDDFSSAIVDKLLNKVQVQISDAFVEIYAWDRIAEKCPYNTQMSAVLGYSGLTRELASSSRRGDVS